MRTRDAATAVFYGQQVRDCGCGCGGACLGTAVRQAARDAALASLSTRPVKRANDKAKK